MSTAKLTVELIDKVSGRAGKAAAAADKLLRSEQRAAKMAAKEQMNAVAHVSRIREKYDKEQARERSRAEKDQERTVRATQRDQARVQAREQRAALLARKTAEREQARRDKLRRQDLINHARGIAKKDRLEKRAAEKLRTEQERTRKESQKMGAVARASLGSFVGNLGAMAVARIASLGIEAIKTGHDFAVLGEKTKFAFGVQLQGKAPVEKTLEHADELAKNLALDVRETRGEYMKLIGTAGEWGGAKGIDEIIRLGADLKHAGESEDSVAILADTFDKIATAGKLTERHLKALGTIGVTRTHVYDALGKHLGIANANEENLAEALSKKGIDAADAMPLVKQALMTGLGTSRPGEIAERFSANTIAGKEARAKANVDLLAFDAADRTSGNYHDAADTMVKASESPQAQKAAGWLSDGVSWIVKTVTNIGNDILEQGLVSDGSSTIDKWFTIDENSFKASGSQVDAGLAKGISEGRLAEQAAGQLGDRVTGALNKSLEVHSPSRATQRTGRHTGEGLALGMQDTTGLVEGASASLAGAALTGVASGDNLSPSVHANTDGPSGRAFGQAGGLAGARIQIGPITVMAADSAEQTGQILGAEIRRELEKALYETALEVGAG